MKRSFHSGCAYGVILGVLFFSAAPLAAHRESERYEGRSLADALRTLQGRGLRIVFSTATVTPDLRVLIEPRAKVARQILDELLEPHDLKAEEGPGGVIQVVRAKPVTAIHLGKPVIPTRTGTIQGQVIDAATSSSLPGVLVQVIDASRSVRTDGEGRFRLHEVQPGTRTLEVSMVGYALVKRTISVTGGRTLSVEIYLAPESGSYSERVIVKASWLERQDPGVGSEVKLGGEELQNLRGVLADDPMRAVHTMPRVATGDDFRTEFSVRGSPYRHVDVVVDGVATPWLQHAVYGDYDTGSVSMLTSDALEQATLRAGAYPHRYGDRLGAQLDLTLRQGSRVARQLHGAVSGTNASVITEGPIGRSERGSWLVTLRRSYLDWPIRQLGESSLTAFEFADAQAKLVYDMRPGQQLSFAFLGGRSRVDERGDRAPEELAESTNRAAMLMLGWRSAFGSRMVLSQQAHLVAHEFINKNQTGRDRDRGTDGELSYRIDVAREMFGGVIEAGGQAQRLRGSRYFSRHGEAIAGGAPQLEGFDGTSWLRSAYVHFNWNVTPRLTVAPGMRVADSTLVHRRTVTRWLLGEWSLGPDWTLNASAGVSHQFPEFEQVFRGIGTQCLRPERATHFDIGIDKSLAKSMRLQATFFNREEREILREPDINPSLWGGVITQASNPGRYENALSGSSRGLELLLERRSDTGLSGWAAYSYGKTRFTDAARGETFWGDFDQRHAINVFGVHRLSDRTSFAVKFRGGTNFPIPGYLTARDGGLFVGQQRNEVRLPNYARLDVRVNRTFNHGGRRLTLFVEVLNVLNRTNLGLADGFFRPSTGEAIGFTEPLIPRFPSAGLRVEF